MSNTTKFTQGIHHAGLTVPDLEKTRKFFIGVLGFEQVGEKSEYPAVFVSDAVVTITRWQARAVLSDPF
jgi:catechol 2,3-dioxygenase-like lactoylglutathione lyase family enzyme